MTSILWLMTAISVSVGVCRYILGAILRITHPNCGVHQDFSFTPDISVLVPAYHEGSAVYSTIASIMESEYSGNIEVIVTDDCSKDSTPEFIRKAAQDFPNVQAVFNVKNLGKTQTLLNALAASWSEPNAYYVANGFEAHNLTIVMPYAERKKACDRWFSVTLPDQTITNHLREVGFTSVQCGQETEPLR